MRLRVAVLGAGSWGTTVASLASHNTPTRLWARNVDLAREITEGHSNPRYLPDIQLPEDLEATHEIGEAVREADVVVMGIPSHGFRSVLTEASRSIRPWVPVISLAKGLEENSQLRMTEIIQEILPGHPAGVLTGPNLAGEIMGGQAAASVIAMEDEKIATQIQDVFRSGLFRVYTNNDVIGCEVAGALKNVIAIAAGMGSGVGVGDNTQAAVITRGLAELTRLGGAMGGHPQTFSGLAGMGDLLATCMSARSRNRHVGVQLGQGRKISEIINEMHMVAEGVKTCRVVMQLADQYGLEMPIAREVVGAVHEGRTALQAYRGLVRHRPGSENEPG
ncbi:NAD(P)H-dependent glycerol-3-phosphate dehydrogenase [Myxococcota bacterium]|nr:NAD(P)H-dependent glycerol-3-phosphate dehydrogenase [Myxococcota bacterium]